MKPATEIRILHVDDDQTFLEASKTILSKEGPFFIETATTVQEALSKWNEHQFDVIISDYDMPQQNGLDLLKIVRDKGSEIPFILFTEKTREEIMVQALNLGADRYINKQGDPQTVYKELSVSIHQLYEKTQAELLLEKLSVVSGFVRHDIKNKLAVITSTLYLCRKNAKNDQQLLKYLEQINDTTENIKNILEFAQTYEAVGSEGLSWIQVHNAINKAQSLFSGLTDVQIDVANMDFEVLADSALAEIFHNLIDDSIKYANTQDKIKIKIKAENDEKGNLQLIYEDNGQGINPKIRPQLFNKGAGNSTGLGLYLIQRICDIYGWTIQENGEPGKGARFVLSIPKELSRTK